METRDRILEAATELYLEGGLPALSMRKVAAMADISAPAIYRHFDSKEALITAVCADGYRLFGQYLFRGLEGGSPLERLRLTGLGYLEFGLDHPGYYRVLFMTNASEHGLSEWMENHREKVSPTFQFLVDRIRECVEAGVIEADELRVLAAEIWSHTHGMVSLWLIGELGSDLGSANDFRRFYTTAMDRHLRGLRPQ
ncbi:MAG: TetR/AcrR family transcriptional regulator [Deltaproteobacteria bacterium]|nr:TetR/AcrR family transcriptional regulator [Deltaproteobacteria bacterium]